MSVQYLIFFNQIILGNLADPIQHKKNYIKIYITVYDLNKKWTTMNKKMNKYFESWLFKHHIYEVTLLLTNTI